MTPSPGKRARWAASSWALPTGALTVLVSGCLSGEVVDLGANYDDRRPADAASEAPGSGPDGGAPDGSGAAPDSGDAMPTSGSQICIVNESFEPSLDGMDASITSPDIAVPPGWVSCAGSGGNTPSICGLAPTEGESYLGLSVGFVPVVLDPASVDTELCAALQPGEWYTLSADVALDAPIDDGGGGEPPALQVKGGTSACDPNAELLTRFSAFAATCTWRRLCATFQARQLDTHLILVPEISPSTGGVFSEAQVLVDHIASGGTCSTL